jgi:hypothetical protein
MIVRTYTSAWNLRTKIYAFDDLKVPVRGGITVPQFLAGLGTALFWIPFCLITGLTHLVGNSGLIAALLIGPPILVTMKADTPVANEKTTEEWLTAWANHKTEPGRLASMVAARDDRPVILTARRWIPSWGDDYGREPSQMGA